MSTLCVVGPFLSLMCEVFVQQGGCDLYGKHLTPSTLRLTISLAVRRIGDTGILTNEVGVCGPPDVSPALSTRVLLP